MMRALLLALALVASTAAQASVPWTIDILPEGVMYPSDVTFNGRRTTNIHGVSVADVVLPDLSPDYELHPQFINDSGQIAGTAIRFDLFSQGFLFDGAIVTFIPDRSTAVALNNLGQVAADTYSATGIVFPGPTPPTWFVVPGYGVGVGLYGIADLNDFGQVLGRVLVFDEEENYYGRYAVLTPVPEPHSTALAAAAIGVIVVLRRRRPNRVKISRT